jgi:hypothetical protein
MQNKIDLAILKHLFPGLFNHIPNPPPVFVGVPSRHNAVLVICLSSHNCRGKMPLLQPQTLLIPVC